MIAIVNPEREGTSIERKVGRGYNRTISSSSKSVALASTIHYDNIMTARESMD